MNYLTITITMSQHSYGITKINLIVRCFVNWACGHSYSTAYRKTKTSVVYNLKWHTDQH